MHRHDFAKWTEKLIQEFNLYWVEQAKNPQYISEKDDNWPDEMDFLEWREHLIAWIETEAGIFLNKKGK